jgi:hypothetical protein
MFKKKGVMIGAAMALVGTALLLAGMAFETASGAPTDGFVGAPDGALEVPAPVGNPPQAPIDQPGTQPIPQPGTGQPGTQPIGDTDTGAPGAGGQGPSRAGAGLPNAGFGSTSESNGFGAIVVLLALAGTAMTAAGAVAFGATRRS